MSVFLDIEHEAAASEAFDRIDDPFALAAAWLAEAGQSEPNDPGAMALATADSEGLPNVRMVLLKDLGPDGFVFYSNGESVKGGELAANPKAALCLYWKSLHRQLRARGLIEIVSDEVADAYFASRARESRIGAWASQQSRPLASREVLEEAVKSREAEFGDGPVPRPPHWQGYRLVPLEIEFWQGRLYRLHDRMQFRRDSAAHQWAKRRLYP
jgi:pyridoxamine 5'-phosphate oxidase